MTQTPVELAAYLLEDSGTDSEGPSFECPSCPGSVVLRLFATTHGNYIVGMGTELVPAAPQPCKASAYPLKDLEPGQVWTVCNSCDHTIWAWETPEGGIGVTMSKKTGISGRLEVPKVMSVGKGGITFKMAARPETVAQLLIVCPNHPEEHLATWERDAEGKTLWSHSETVRVENIAEPADEKVQGFFTLPDAPPANTDEPHIRYVFRCSRPSCNYDGQIIGEKLTPKIEKTLDGMVASGIPLMRVTSPEADGHLKPVR